MAFTIGYIHVSRDICLILFNEAGPPEFPLNGAVLWDNNQQPLSSSELILRSMWLSLATKAMEEQWQVEVGADSAGLATNLTILRPSTTARSLLSSSDAERTELIQQLLHRQERSLVGASVSKQ